MKKKLIFCLCIALSIIICFSCVPFSAYTYDCDVEVTSSAALVVNVDTGTVVYEKNSNVLRYSSYLSNIMTFVVVCNNTTDLDKRITVKSDVLAKVKNSDNSLKKYVGRTLTIEDLLHYLLLTDGTDAAYILADYISKGNINNFVSLMNKKATALGCVKTKFSAPGVVFDATQVTTCADMYKIVECALTIPEYKEISVKTSYLPTGYKKPSLEIQNTNSMVKSKSPYYFRYVTSGKYGEDTIARGNVAVSSEYSDVNYVCVVMGSSTSNEHNAFTEAKQLMTWAYTNLGNKTIITEEDTIDTVKVNTSWGQANIELSVSSDITRTMPGDYKSSLLTFKYIPSMQISPPVFVGQNMGAADMYYDGEFYEQINVVSKSSYGVSMVGDMQSFVEMMFSDTLNRNETAVNVSDTQSSTQAPVVKETQSVKQNKPTETPTVTQAENSTQAVQ